MPRFKQTQEILRLMGRKEAIRNVGIIAHIDHGKTTMTDSLLYEAGLLPRQVAGSARALDYLEEEQRRGITIKTANISLLHVMDGRSYVINLVDTPGHVDFTGKVTRALRAIDGAVVVIDAVEEVMAQTETVTRQALEERVKPVLFINKLDRLIEEMKLTPAEIQKKLNRITADFNNLIENYAEPEFKKWKVDPAEGSVVFGSALHKWGFTLRTANEKGIKLGGSDILDAHGRIKHQQLSRLTPLHTAILDKIVKNLPSPVESQKYRIPKIWKGKTDSEIGQAMLNCDDKGPATMCITMAQTIPGTGLVATGRLFSGSIKQGDEVHLVEENKTYRVQQVMMYMGAFREPINSITSGNIAALSGIDMARAGNTLVDNKQKEAMVPFEHVKYAAEPVMTISVEPKKPSDLPRVIEAMNKLLIEDPNLTTTIDKETGQYLISGIGELHLEIAMNSLKQIIGDAELTTSSPIPAYRETVTKQGRTVMAKSPNKRNNFWIQVQPAESRLSKQKKEEQAVSQEAEESNHVWATDENRNELINSSPGAQHLEEAKASIIAGFNWACRSGALCEQPLREVQARLMKTELDPDPSLREPDQITRAVSRAILGSFLTAKPVLLEPIYKIEVTVQPQWFGTCTNIISRRRGKILRTEQKGLVATITGYIPVEETLGLSAEMRTATSGYAFWQFVFDHWSKIPENLADQLITKLRETRGLPKEIPRPETFVDEA
ncbi:MAG: GTP-binding protein [Candidatus Bathyarchaeia archaeon]|jgi:elongation factor 2